MVSPTSPYSPSDKSIPAVMLTRMPRAPCRLTSSSSGLRIAASVASRARFGPVELPVPIIAMPISPMTVLTSAKSTFIRPGRCMMSEMPRTAPVRTSSALANAESRLASLPRMVSSFSLGMVISESTHSDSARMPSSATCMRRRPSNGNGRVTTAMAVVTRPFPFEGRRRMQVADEGIRALSECVDSLITIPNEKLLTILGKDASLLSAFAKADDVLTGAVRGISDIMQRPGLMNVDFADVKTVMGEMGMAMMGTGSSTGPNRAREATEAAIRNPLLEDVNLQGARGILVNITAGLDLSLGEYSAVGEVVNAIASEHATCKAGAGVDPDMRDELHVTVVATGLGPRNEKPVKVVDNTVHSAAVAAQAPQAPRQDQAAVNYRDLDRPTVMRNQAHAAATAAKLNPQEDLDYLDIPAFLRRQAD